MVKTASKKTGVLTCFLKFLSAEITLYLYLKPSMEYCFNFWTGAPSCYFDILDKLQVQIYRIVAPTLVVFLEPLAHRRNVARGSLFYRCW